MTNGRLEGFNDVAKVIKKACLRILESPKLQTHDTSFMLQKDLMNVPTSEGVEPMIPDTI